MRLPHAEGVSPGAVLTLWLGLSASLPATATSTAPRIELVTLAPGDALYALWGHTAVRVIESHPHRERAYNFGSIDFSGPIFRRMLTGQVDAYVHASPYHQMAELYRQEQRSILRQPLHLPPDQARALAAYLEQRADPRRPPYRYHHFDDNCSSQVADAIDQAMQGSLSAQFAEPSPRTLRSLALAPLQHRWLFYVAVDTLLTGTVDREGPRWQARFLPSELSAMVAQAQGARHRALASPGIVDYRGADAQVQTEWTWPWLKVYLLFLLPLMLLSLRAPRAMAMVWMGFCGVCGLVLVLAWVGTGYDFLHHNWNLLVLPPTHLWGLWVLARRPANTAALRGLRAYVAVHGLVLLGLTAASALDRLPQAIGPVLGLALVPALGLVFYLGRPR